MGHQTNKVKRNNPNTKNIVFAVVLIGYHIVTCSLFTTVYEFRSEAFSNFRDSGGMLLIGGLTILMVIGSYHDM